MAASTNIRIGTKGIQKEDVKKEDNTKEEVATKKTHDVAVRMIDRPPSPRSISDGSIQQQTPTGGGSSLLKKLKSLNNKHLSDPTSQSSEPLNSSSSFLNLKESLEKTGQRLSFSKKKSNCAVFPK